jgi:hypothetical protein
MASIVSAGTTSATALNMSADTTGILQLASNNGTVAVTVDTSQNVGIKNTVATTMQSVSGAGTLTVGSGSGNQGVTVYSGTTALGSICFAKGTTGVQTYQGYITYDQSANAMSFGTNGGVENMRIDSGGNVNIGSSTTPNTGSLSNRFLQLVAYGYGAVGTAASNGVLTFTCNISANTATTFLTCADIDKWGGVILISYVRDADQNRSGMMMVRYRYNRTYTTLLDSSQNSGATFSVSANNLQVTIGGAGTYLTQFTIWGSAGP